jgi:hypothetical protein
MKGIADRDDIPEKAEKAENMVNLLERRRKAEKQYRRRDTPCQISPCILKRTSPSIFIRSGLVS